MSEYDVHEAVQRFPLSWPSGWVRTPSGKRQAATFTQTKSDIVGDGDNRRIQKRAVHVSTFVATQRLEGQLERLGAADPTLSTNVRLRMDGRPYSSSRCWC